MSSEELVNAYLDGGISRRIFVKRMVAAGVSAGAAISYAHLLAPEARAAESSGDDFYGSGGPEVRLRSKRLKGIVERGELRALVSSDEAGRIGLWAGIHSGGKRITVANGAVAFAQPGIKGARLALTKRGRDILARRERARIVVQARTGRGQSSFSFDLS